MTCSVANGQTASDDLYSLLENIQCDVFTKVAKYDLWAEICTFSIDVCDTISAVGCNTCCDHATQFLSSLVLMTQDVIPSTKQLLSPYM